MQMQALAFEAQTDTSYTPLKDSPLEQFPYGWREVMKPLPTGETIYDQVPLTAQDLFKPQLGDQVPQRPKHLRCVVDLFASLTNHYDRDPTTVVFSDLIMDWGIPGLARLAPDIAIVPNIRDKDTNSGIFQVPQEGTRPCLIIEVMSPSYHADETKKRQIYEQAGVAEYLLINPHTELAVPHYEITGYRLVTGVYCPMCPDPEGRWLSQTLQLWFSVADQGGRVRIQDVRTKQWLLTPTETAVARQQEQEARLAAEARAETEAQARAQLEQRLRELEAQLQQRPQTKN